MSPLTGQQKRVVEELDRSFCVSSGAGCGKTLVLVERYLQALDTDHELPLSRIAAITFTDMAAAEMRERIRKACRERIARARDEGERVDLDRWRRRYWDVDVAPISTIHGFCMSLLRQHPIEAGVDPNFALLDEADAAFLAEEVAGGTIEELVGAEDEAAMAVLEHLTLRELREVLIDILRNRRDELDRVVRRVMERSDEEILRQIHSEIGARQREAYRKVITSESVRDALGRLRRHRGQKSDKLEPIRKGAIEAANEIAAARTPEVADRAGEWLAREIRVNAGSAKKWPSKEALAEVKEALKTIREGVRDARKDLPVFDEEIERRHLVVARALFAVARRAAERYQEAKRDRSRLDFEDLQIMARDLLRGQPHVVDELRRQYRTVLVDELQDTNFLQFEIVELLTRKVTGAEGETVRPGAFFGVGDPKQSIYRFRGARVEVFNEALEMVRTAGQQQLTQSWRLHPGIAGLVNRVFPPLMEDAYEPIEGMQKQASEHAAEVRVVTNPDDDGFLAERGRAEEARVLARRLREIAEGDDVRVYDRDAKTVRPAGYNDMAVLLRRMTNLHVYEQALEREGVPYHVVAGGGFYKQQETLDVLNLLRVLDEPTDDLHLAGVLRSPFFAVSDEGLLRLRRMGGHLAAALQRLDDVADLSDEDRRGLERAARLLPEWTADKDRLGLAALVDRVVFDSGYAAASTGRVGGARVYGNLRQLAELAHAFQDRGLHGLRDFIDYVADFMQSGMRQEQAPLRAPGGESVRLMTVHKAKGLEFPIVAVPDLVHSDRPSAQPYYIHPVAGLAVRLRDDDGNRCPSGAAMLAKADEKEAELAESYRILYVAMTRAEDYLLFPAYEPANARGGEMWLDHLLAALREDLDEGDRTVPLPSGHTVALSVGSPSRERHRHDRRQVGPRDVITNGRIDRLALARRAEAASADRVDEALARVRPPRPTVPGPLRVAAGALDTYRKCPRLYWWRHVAGLDDAEPREPRAEGLTAAERGTLVHRALELAASPETAGLEGAVNQTLRELAPVTAEAGKDLRPELLAAVERFGASGLGRRANAAPTAYTEIPLFLQLHPGQIAGKVDLLFRRDDGRWELVDYKPALGRGSSPAERLDRYWLQLGAYALAVGRWLSEMPARASAYDYHTGEAASIDITVDVAERWETGIREVIDGIAAGQFEAEAVTCDVCRLARACRGLQEGGMV